MKTTTSKIKTLYELKKVNSDIGAHKDFIARVQALQSAQQQIEDEWASLKQAMLANDVSKISGDWGIIQFVPTVYLKADGDLPNRFTKKVLDTDKIKAYQTLRGNLPQGVKASIVNKFVKRIK